MAKNRKNCAPLFICILLTLSMISSTSYAQLAGTGRIELQRHDLSVTGRELLQVLVEIEPGKTYPPHSHPGEEIVYVREGLLEYSLEGRKPIVLKQGDVLFIPSGVTHSVKNVGKAKGIELATYIVEKGKQLIEKKEN